MRPASVRRHPSPGRNKAPEPAYSLRTHPYLPAWHYLAGYLKLEADETAAAIAELKQIEQRDPLQELLLARAHEKAGDRAEAGKAYRAVVDSKQNGIERALAYPEAKRKLAG